MNMKNWFQEAIAAKEKTPLPVLSFPVTQLMGITVRDFISDSDLQAEGIKLAAERSGSAAALSMMDLSVEAEAFGSTIRITDNEVPTVIGALFTDEETAEAYEIPAVGTARTGLYIEGVRKAKERIKDRPVLAGVIGPFSLAGRLLDVNEALVLCYEEPELVDIVMEKATRFSIAYLEAYKAAGADGVVMAEPLTGLLSPALAEEFSAPYVKKIIDAVQTDDFGVIYHNCGGAVPKMLDSILDVGAMAYHFGNAIDLTEVLPRIPADIPVFGNINPTAMLTDTPEQIRESVLALLEKCSPYPNHILSTGCDIPPGAKWENIDAFFAAAHDFYENR